MTFGRVTADGGPIDTLGTDQLFEDFEGVQVAFPAQDGLGTTCCNCGDPIDQNAQGLWVSIEDDDEDVRCEATGFDGPHEPATGPGSWCNSASVRVDEDENSVTVAISVGDPRGAFTMTVRRRPDTGQLVLHVPHEGMTWAHMPLTRLHEGTFLVGGQ